MTERAINGRDEPGLAGPYWIWICGSRNEGGTEYGESKLVVSVVRLTLEDAADFVVMGDIAGS